MPSPEFSDPSEVELDPKFQAAVHRLHRATVIGRWLVVIGLWSTIGVLSLWGLRYPISLMLDYFTWAALRTGLASNFLPTIGLGICIGMTLSVLIWQSRNILFGLPIDEQQNLKKTVLKIRQQGKSHPLWRWIEPSDKS